MSLRAFIPVFVAIALSGQPIHAQAPVSTDGQLSSVNGTRLWYKVGGRGDPGTAPLLFLHGGPGLNSYAFEKTIGTKLEQHFQVIYLDQRGAGRSERPASRDYSMPTLVEDIEALRKLLGVPKLSVLGHSFGGPIALEYASHYPSHVAKLIIVDGAVDMPDAFKHWQTLLESRYPQIWHKELEGPSGDALRAAQQIGDTCAVAKQRAGLVMRTVAKVGPQDFRSFQQWHSATVQHEQEVLDAASGLHNTGEFMQAYFSPGNDFFCYRFSAFSSISMPVLVVGGKYDGSVDFEQMETLAHNIPGAKLVEFDNSAHFPYAEEPAKFDTVVTQFLRLRQ